MRAALVSHCAGSVPHVHENPVLDQRPLQGDQPVRQPPAIHLDPRDALLAALDRIHPEQLLGTILNDHTEVRSDFYARRAQRANGAHEGKVQSGAQPRGRKTKA